MARSGPPQANYKDRDLGLCSSLGAFGAARGGAALRTNEAMAFLVRLPALDAVQEEALRRWAACRCNEFYIVAVESTEPSRRRLAGGVLLRQRGEFESVMVRLLRSLRVQCSGGWLRIASEQECIGELWLAMSAEKLRDGAIEFLRRNRVPDTRLAHI